jgi:hypothetical protein
MPGGAPGGGSGAIFDMLGKMAKSMLGGAAGPGGSGGFSPFDMLSSIGKTVFGGSSGSAAGPSSAGWGANTVLGAIAAKALEMAKAAMSGDQAGGQSQAFDIDDATAVIAGLRKPANTRGTAGAGRGHAHGAGDDQRRQGRRPHRRCRDRTPGGQTA